MYALSSSQALTGQVGRTTLFIVNQLKMFHLFSIRRELTIRLQY